MTRMGTNSRYVSSADAIKSAVRLSEYIKKFTPLKGGAGGKWTGKCPIHKDSSPSLSVDDEKGLWICFAGCGAGTIIDFKMVKDGMDFQDALKSLGDELGVEVTHERQGVSRIRVLELLESLCSAAHECFMDKAGQTARDYLRERGMKRSQAIEWSLGFIPAGKRGELMLRSCGTPRELEAAGISYPTNHGSWVPYIGRLVFPVMDRSGKVVGFGGRQVPGVESTGSGKYVNPTDTIAYQKARVLYGMQLLDPKHPPELVLVNEGYLDVVGVASIDGAGVPVACCGSFITPQQAELLADVNRVVVMLDGDTAGAKGVSNAVWLANRFGDRVEGALLPEGVDPWELSRSDPDGMVRTVSEASPLVQVAAQARFLVDGDGPKFDKWVAATYAQLSFASHRDQLIEEASRLRKQASRIYMRHLPSTTGSDRTFDSGTATVESSREWRSAFSGGAIAIAGLLLGMDDITRDSVLSGIEPWDSLAEMGVKTWLPIESDADFALLGRVIAGGSKWELMEPLVGRAFAELSMNPKDNPDPGPAIRGIITRLIPDVASVLEKTGDRERAGIERSALRLRRLQIHSRDQMDYPNVLAEVLDTVRAFAEKIYETSRPKTGP